MARTRYYYYDIIGKSIHRANVTDNLIGQYEFKILTGKAKGFTGYSCSFKSLLTSKNFIFGKLKTLKVLYGR